jgi:tetratricopeptide (TPR) repeat protein
MSTTSSSASSPSSSPSTDPEIDDEGTFDDEGTSADEVRSEPDEAAVAGPVKAATTRKLRPDELRALQEQRDFLLRSLDDLEEEHVAGDVDDEDYRSLRDDYTTRAARVIRALDAHQARVAGPRSSKARWRAVATVAGVVLFALGAGVLVAQAAGRRQSGDSLTGNIRQSTRDQVDDAISVAAGGDFAAAVDDLDAVLQDDPDNVEALTYKGWFQYRSSDPGFMDTLTDAVATDPEYPAAHAFLAVILRDLEQYDYALLELDRLDRLDPPQEILDQVAGLREDLEERGAQLPDLGSPSTTAP